MRRRLDALDGGLEVFATKGYDGAQMAEIAAASGLPLAALYSMFQGKDNLYQEVIRHVSGLIRDRVRSRVEPIEGAVARLQELPSALLDCFEDNRGTLLLVLSGTGGLPWRVREKLGEQSHGMLDRFHDWVISLCEDAIKEASGSIGASLQPIVLAASIIGAITNTASWTLDRHPDQNLTEPIADIQRLIRGLLVSQSMDDRELPPGATKKGTSS